MTWMKKGCAKIFVLCVAGANLMRKNKNKALRSADKQQQW